MLHVELSAQPIQTVTQLKRNGVHPSDTLTEDQTVVEETDINVESNYNLTAKELIIRFRVHSKESRGTTRLTPFGIVTVFLSFFVVFFIIRFIG